MSTRMNVLYLVRTWAIGGSHTIIFLLLRHLPKERFNIVCVPFDTPSKSDDAFVRALKLRDLPVASERVPWHSRLGWWTARNAISELIEKYDIDLIHTHDPQSNVLAGIGRNRWPCAVVASPYGWWARMFPLRSHVYNWVERSWALPNVDEVITVSQDMKRKILRGPTREDRINVIYTGLDPAEMQAGAPRAEVRAALGIPDDACVVGTVSRVYVEKGHTFLLDAVCQVADSVPQLHLLIVGEGPLRPALERLGRAKPLERVPAGTELGGGGSLAVVAGRIGAAVRSDAAADGETVERDRARLDKELAEAERLLDAARARLSDPKFVERAPEQVVDGARAKVAELEDKLSRAEVIEPPKLTGETVTVGFKSRVDYDAPRGVRIRNQATVTSAELPPTPSTDNPPLPEITPLTNV